MEINGLGNAAYNQKYQTPAERTSGQSVKQQAPPPEQEPPEENRQSASMRSQEAVAKTEGTESKSVYLYA